MLDDYLDFEKDLDLYDEQIDEVAAPGKPSAQNLPMPDCMWSTMKAGHPEPEVMTWELHTHVALDDDRLPSAAATWATTVAKYVWTPDAGILIGTLGDKVSQVTAVAARREIEGRAEWTVSWWKGTKFDGARGGIGPAAPGITSAASATVNSWVKGTLPDDIEDRMWATWRAKREAELLAKHRKAAVEVATQLGARLIDVRTGVVDGGHSEVDDVVCPTQFPWIEEFVRHAAEYHGVDVRPDIERAIAQHDEAHDESGAPLGAFRHRHERWPLGEPPKPRKRKEASDGEEG